MCACVRVCVCACVRACVRACACAVIALLGAAQLLGDPDNAAIRNAARNIMFMLFNGVGLQCQPAAVTAGVACVMMCVCVCLVGYHPPTNIVHVTTLCDHLPDCPPLSSPLPIYPLSPRYQEAFGYIGSSKMAYQMARNPSLFPSSSLPVRHTRVVAKHTEGGGGGKYMCMCVYACVCACVCLWVVVT